MRVTRVTTADLDRLEFDAVRSGEHGRVAAQLQDLANRIDSGSEVSRAELFVRSGEQWEIAQEFVRACAAYQRAMDDGGPTVVDARALHAGALLQMDETDLASSSVWNVTNPTVWPPTCTSPRYFTLTVTTTARSVGRPRGSGVPSRGNSPPGAVTCWKSCCASDSGFVPISAWPRTNWTVASTRSDTAGT